MGESNELPLCAGELVKQKVGCLGNAADSSIVDLNACMSTLPSAWRVRMGILPLTQFINKSRNYFRGVT